MHDAQEGFVRPPDALWQRYPDEPEGGEVICHDDLFWPNIVFDGSLPTALIDWDLATPGSRLEDVGSAVSYRAPLHMDDQAYEWGLSTDRRCKRLRLPGDAYGLGAGQRAALLDDFVERRRLSYEAHRVWGGAERRPGRAEMWDGGSGQRILGNIAWVEDHRKELDTWLG